MLYDIVRYYVNPRRSELVKRGVSLKVGENHIANHDSHRIGVYFDGLRKSPKFVENYIEDNTPNEVNDDL